MNDALDLFLNLLFLIVGGPLFIIFYHICISRAVHRPYKKTYHSTIAFQFQEHHQRITHTAHYVCSDDNCCEARKCAELQKRLEELEAKNALLEEQTTQLRLQREQTIRDSKFYSMELEDGLIQERDENERFYQHRQSMANDLHEKERSRLVQQGAQQHQKHQKEKVILNDSIMNLRGENQHLRERVQQLGKSANNVDKDAEITAMLEEANQYRTEIQILQEEKSYWKAYYRQEKLTADIAIKKNKSLETKNGELALQYRELTFQNEKLRTANKREVGKASRVREECVRLRYEILQREHETERQSEINVKLHTPIGVV